VAKPHKLLILVTGGVRSGKSTFAERLAPQLAEEREAARGEAAARGGRVIYLATSEINDEEMAARVAAHRATRPAAWTTVECPLEVPAAVREHAGPAAAGGPAGTTPAAVFLLDCVTFWVSNLLFAGGSFGGSEPPQGFNYDDSLIPAEQERAVAGRVSAAVADLLAALAETGATLVAVTNEVGLGVVPEYPLARLYRDQLGWANQRLARAADRVYFLVSGYPLDVKLLASLWPEAGAPADVASDSHPLSPFPVKESDQ
jgi:adenosylcobinamide kinase/adenosylcobinamide-phosphate guanylyltransferase